MSMSGQRKLALNLANVVQGWKTAYTTDSNKNTKDVHNALCDLLNVLNRWLLEREGSARVIHNPQVGSIQVGPIQDNWKKIP